MNSRTLTRAIGAIAAALALACPQPLSAFAQDDAARAEAIARADKQMMQLLHAVQLGVERYAVDHGSFPPSLQPLMDEGYLSDPPANPYFGLDERAPEKLLEEELKLRPTPGAVVYHPYSLNGSTLDGYILLAAGTKDSDSQGLHAHDLFYGEPRWDSLYSLIDGGTQDGRPERYILLLSRPILHPEHAWEVSIGTGIMGLISQERARDVLHAVQLAVERYGIDHDGPYPPDLQTIVDEGYIYWPVNPYYGLLGAPLRIQACAPGEFIPGGIVYEPMKMPERFGDDLVGYTLAIYGDDPDGGGDAGAVYNGEWQFYWEKPANPDGIRDGFILVLSSGPAPEGEECPDGT